MSRAPAHPTLAAEVSKYPTQSQAKVYLRDFLTGTVRAFLQTARYAYYQHSPSIQVIIIHLKRHIYEVRAYPVDAFFVSSIDEALKVHDFRAWLFTLDDRTRSIHYIAGSQRIGVQRYKQVKRAIKSNRTLALASQAY
ncbi:unnamed protein product [marine sediment metagenome]|uniref:Uncharacterized protein n=1 Tax=marine sediment metagenome TaxID=412755 RepID=X1T9Z3_9ZZZZ